MLWYAEAIKNMIEKAITINTPPGAKRSMSVEEVNDFCVKFENEFLLNFYVSIELNAGDTVMHFLDLVLKRLGKLNSREIDVDALNMMLIPAYLLAIKVENDNSVWNADLLVLPYLDAVCKGFYARHLLNKHLELQRNGMPQKYAYEDNDRYAYRCRRYIDDLKKSLSLTDQAKLPNEIYEEEDAEQRYRNRCRKFIEYYLKHTDDEIGIVSMLKELEQNFLKSIDFSVNTKLVDPNGAARANKILSYVPDAQKQVAIKFLSSQGAYITSTPTVDTVLKMTGRIFVDVQGRYEAQDNVKNGLIPLLTKLDLSEAQSIKLLNEFNDRLEKLDANSVDYQKVASVFLVCLASTLEMKDDFMKKLNDLTTREEDEPLFRRVFPYFVNSNEIKLSVEDCSDCVNRRLSKLKEDIGSIESYYRTISQNELVEVRRKSMTNRMMNSMRRLMDSMRTFFDYGEFLNEDVRKYNELKQWIFKPDHYENNDVNSDCFTMAFINSFFDVNSTNPNITQLKGLHLTLSNHIQNLLISNENDAQIISIAEASRDYLYQTILDKVKTREAIISLDQFIKEHLDDSNIQNLTPVQVGLQTPVAQQPSAATTSSQQPTSTSPTVASVAKSTSTLFGSPTAARRKSEAQKVETDHPGGQITPESPPKTPRQ